MKLRTRTILLLSTVAVLVLSTAVAWRLHFSNNSVKGGESTKFVAVFEPRIEPTKSGPLSVRNHQSDRGESVESGGASTKIEELFKIANQPILFFGRTVDQDGQPISGLEVRAKVRHWVLTANTNMAITFYTNTVVSAGDGSFSISGIAGESMRLEFENQDYELEQPIGLSFGFGPGVSITHQPDPNTPVTFRLWKKGAGAYVDRFSWGKDIHADGSAHFMDLKHRKVSTTPITNALVVMASVQRFPLEQKWGRFNADSWGFEISVPGGVIQETSDVFLYRPPAEGYSNSIRAAFVKVGDNIRKRDKKSVYVRFASGEYGGGRIEVWADRSGTDALVRLDFSVNPDGSRNLEHDPRAQP